MTAPLDTSVPIRLYSSGAAFVTFAYDNKDGDTETVPFAVSADMLWSSAGIAKMYEDTRGSFLSPPESEHHQVDVWESWRLVKVEEETDYYILRPRFDAFL